MGNAAIYWRTAPHLEARTIDLGQKLTMYRLREQRLAPFTEVSSGLRVATPIHTATRVSVECQGLSYALERELKAMTNHIRREGGIALTLNSEKVFSSFAGFIGGYGEETLMFTTGNQWAGYGSDTCGSNDVMTLTTPSPVYVQEDCAVLHRITSGSLEGQWEFDEVRHDYTAHNYESDDYLHVRWAGFWPALRVLDHSLVDVDEEDGRTTFTLRMELVEDVYLISRQAAARQAVFEAGATNRDSDSARLNFAGPISPPSDFSDYFG